MLIDNEYDQTYFVQLDINSDAYVYGQTESSWAISPGCYGTPNSGQFIRKYNTNLTSIYWTTMIGAGSGHVEISPTDPNNKINIMMYGHYDK